MKSAKNLLEQLKSLPYFTKESVLQLSRPYGLAKTTVDTYISRSMKRKDILSLRRGLYVSADFYNKNKSDTSYLFFLANVIRKPSYVSSWAALQYYGLATEAIHTITSVTSKVTRTYVTKAGNFVYSSIKDELFSDSVLIKGKFDFFIATPAKALFDLLYAKTRQFQGVAFEHIPRLVEELRIDIDEMDKSEREKFYMMVKKYTHHG
ncbi:MAG: hypothetical protein Q7S08_03805 [bacterium]|nr:hypothetical protein [bacterium]